MKKIKLWLRYVRRLNARKRIPIEPCGIGRIVFPDVSALDMGVDAYREYLRAQIAAFARQTAIE